MVQNSNVCLVWCKGSTGDCAGIRTRHFAGSVIATPACKRRSSSSSSLSLSPAPRLDVAGAEVWFQSFVVSALDGGEWLTYAPAALPPAKNSVTHSVGVSEPA